MAVVVVVVFSYCHVSVGPSVRPSQAAIVSRRVDGSSRFLAWRLSLTYHTLRCNQIWIPREKRVISSRSLSQILVDQRQIVCYTSVDRNVLTLTALKPLIVTVVERRFLTGELSLSCARPAADG